MFGEYGIKAMLSKEAIISTEQDFVKAIRSGKIFVYPTDTVYGIGCNALNKKAVEKIYKIKKRSRKKPLSIIAPSFGWILKNFHVDSAVLKKYFPGSFTLILPKKKKSFLSAISRGSSVGVRIPNHQLTKLIQKSEVPFVTTSANLSGIKSAGSLKDVDFSVLNSANIIIDGGKLPGKPSTIVDLVSKEIIERN